MFPTGIDWSEKHLPGQRKVGDLDYCIENNSGNVILRSRVDNDDNGFNSMLQSFAKEKSDLSEIAVAIESPNQRIVDFLLARGISVYPVNPKAVHDYRKSRFPTGNKSDAADAQLLADYLREHHTHLRVWRLPEPELRQLKLLVEDRDKVVTEKVRLPACAEGRQAEGRQEGRQAKSTLLADGRQLRSTLRSYFPQSVDAFCDITCPTSLDFLDQFPTFKVSDLSEKGNRSKDRRGLATLFG